MPITFNSGYDNSPHKKANPVERGTIYSGSAMSFDGSNDYLDIFNSEQVSASFQSLSDALTISMWFKADAVSGNETGAWYSYYTIAEMRTETSSGTHIPFSLGVNNSKISFGVTDNHTTSDERIDGTTSISTDTWYHVAVTMSGDDYVIYLDGSSDKSGTLSTATGDRSVGTTNSNFFIGARSDNDGDGGSFFDGLISNVQVWNTVLTLAQIQELYTQPELILPTGITSSNLKGHWLLNEGAGTSVFDSHMPSGEKKFGETSMYFLGNNGSSSSGGTSDYIGIPDHNDLDFGANDFTIEFWYNIASALHNKMISKKGNAWHMEHYGNTNGFMSFRFNGDNTKAVRGEAGSAESPNWGWSAGWHHVAVTRESTNLRMWVDGVLKETFDIGTTAMNTNTDDISFGGYGGATYSTTGYMDDIRISDIARYTDTDGFDAPTSAFVSDANTLVLIHADNSRNKGAGQVINSASTDHVATAYNNATLTDYRSHGTVNGATWSPGNNEIYQTGLTKGRSPIVFEEEYITIADTDDLDFGTGEFSLSTWFIDQGSSTTYPSILSSQGGWGANGFSLRYDNSSYDGKVTLHWSSSGDPMLYSGVLPKHVLHHVGFTRVGTTGRLYINGALVHENTCSSTLDIDLCAGGSFRIGGYNWDTTDSYFKGFVDETAVWNKYLSASEMVTLYNNGIPYAATNVQSSNLQGYWRNDGTGTWTDRSTNSNHGAISGTPASAFLPEGSTAGKDILGFPLANTDADVLTLNGANYMEIADSDTLSFGDGTNDFPFSIEAWIKMDNTANFVIVAKGVYNSTGEWLFGTDSSNLLKFQLHDESVADTYEKASTATVASHEGTWTHVCATYNGVGGTSANGGILIYINGVSQSLTLADNGTYVAMENLGASCYIGRYDTDYAEGLIDELRIYSNVLSAAEVVENFNYGAEAKGKTLIEV